MLPHPLTIKAADWKDDMKLWPPLQGHQITYYLLKSKACDLEDVQALKSLNSYNYVISGKGGQLLVHQAEKDVFIKGSVGLGRPISTYGMQQQPAAAVSAARPAVPKKCPQGGAQITGKWPPDEILVYKRSWKHIISESLPAVNTVLCRSSFFKAFNKRRDGAGKCLHCPKPRRKQRHGLINRQDDAFIDRLWGPLHSRTLSAHARGAGGSDLG